MKTMKSKSKKQYDKLIKKKEKSKGDWNKEDFVEYLTLIMERQSISEPAVKQACAKLGPEWENSMKTVLKLFLCQEKDEAELIEKIVALGEAGTRALVDVILNVKRRS